MINQTADEKINKHVADTLLKGASLITSPRNLPQGSHYVAPIVLRNADGVYAARQEETFGRSHLCSGLGREGSTLGIEEYLETKAFHIGGIIDASADRP